MRSSSFPGYEFLAIVGGVLFVPYALVKGPVTRTIVETGIHLPGTTVGVTANLFHLVETLPVLLVLVAVRELDADALATRDRLGRGGYWLAHVGVAMLIGFHVVEHFGVPGLDGAGLHAAFVWGYHFGWPVLFLGLAAFGLAIARTGAAPGWVPALLVALLPVGLLCGLGLVALDLFTFAGTQRILAGGALAAIGYERWRGRAAAGADAPAPG